VRSPSIDDIWPASETRTGRDDDVVGIVVRLPPSGPTNSVWCALPRARARAEVAGAGDFRNRFLLLLNKNATPFETCPLMSASAIPTEIDASYRRARRIHSPMRVREDLSALFTAPWRDAAPI